MKKAISRRQFLCASASVPVAASLAASRARAGCPHKPPVFKLKRRPPALADLTGGRPPNILLVLTDQERWRGNLPATLKRPNFDRLCRNAVSFDRAFCSYPLCSPSRSSIFSGLYPHQNGVTANLGVLDGKRPLSRRAPHIGSVLASAGYQVGYKGKWDLSRGSRSWLMDPSERGRAGDYGFDGHCGKVPDQEYGCRSDDQVVAESCQWIKKAAGGKPWFLCCSIINPHDICHPRLKPDQSIRPDAVLPASLYDDLRNKPKDQLQRRKRRDLNSSYADYTERDWKLFLSFYYDLIESTDRYLAQLFSALADAARDTIIIYTSDHGEMGGAHGCHGKYELYEEAVRIPLYFHHPLLKPGSAASLESNVSIAPTIAALAGVEWPGPFAGRDLSSLIIDPGAPGRDAVFIEHETLVNYGFYRDMNAARAIRTERWKLVRSLLDAPGGELYDLDKDPAEMTNLYCDPACQGIRRELEDRLRAWQKATADRARYLVAAR